MRSSTLSRRRELPRHVAVIMDGNGRWAKSRGLDRSAGHDEGARAVREVVRTCRDRGVRYLTLYAFSLANWSRPKLEVESLMRLMIRFAEKELAELIEKNINVRVIGDLDDLPTPTRRAVEHLIQETNKLPPGETEHALTLTLALSYSGRRDVVDAMREIAARADDFAHRASPFVVTRGAVESAAFGPTAIAVHDDRYVPWQLSAA